MPSNPAAVQTAAGFVIAEIDAPVGATALAPQNVGIDAIDVVRESRQAPAREALILLRQSSRVNDALAPRCEPRDA